MHINHSSIWKFIDVIKYEEKFASTKLQKFMHEEPSQKYKILKYEPVYKIYHGKI